MLSPSSPFCLRFLILALVASRAVFGGTADPIRLERDLSASWSFRFGEQAAVPTLQQAAEWAQVQVPHTWNASDGADGGGNYARGTGWYVRHFTLDGTWENRRVFVEFDGASRVARVFLNGQPLGEHVGGFARFRFELTPALRRESENVLAVAVSNAPDGTPPFSADFTFFGGLYRGVRLIGVHDLHVELLDHGSSGVFVTPQRVNAESAEVAVAALVRNAGAQPKLAEFEVTLRDAAGNVAGRKSAPIDLPAGETTRANLSFSVAQPRLWRGRRDPHRYRAEVVLRSGGVTCDRVEEKFGLRSFRVDAGAGFILNGEPLDLRGASRHQDRAGKGWAIDDADEREDMALLLEMGATAVRVAHYQQSPRWFELADEAGLVVWAEIPVVNEVPAASHYLENARQQLRELIRQNYNRPGIVVWGVGNETREEDERSGGQQRPNGEQSTRVIAELTQTAKTEDPSRLAVYASHHRPEDVRNFQTEVVAFNRYQGWYGGATKDIGPWLDEVHRRYPALRLGLSEYGAGANPAHHESPARKPAHAGPWHPEEYQSEFHEDYWRVLRSRPWVWCKFIWNLCDFAVDARAEGGTTGMNDKGLVSYDRTLRKDAFYWYKANWSDEPVLHLTSRRFTERPSGRGELKAYSNATRVEAWLDGRPLGAVESGERIFRWAVALEPGEHRVVVRADNLHDEMTFRCSAPNSLPP